MERYKLKNKKEREEKTSQYAEAAVVNFGSDGDVLLVTATDSRGATEWVMDSGCTYHMCPHRDWFSTYESLDSGVVLMGNNAQCSVANIGTVQIKTHDRVLRTLSNVRHIPDLKRNLISLGTLESNGRKYSAEGGVLTISKGALVLMK